LLTAGQGLPSVSYATAAVPCSTSFTANVAIGPNEALVPYQLVFEVVAANPEGSASSQATVSLTVPEPEVLTTSAEPADLGDGGGTVVITARVKDATSCHLELASPYLGFPVVYSAAPTTCSGGIFTTNVSIGANNTMISRPVSFSVVGSNGGGASQGRVGITMAANPDDSATPQGTREPAPSVTVAPSNPPGAFNVGATIVSAVPDRTDPAHLTTTFSAEAHVNCFTGPGKYHPCPLPARSTGVITWQVFKMGDWQQDEDLSACTTNITTAKPASSCKVWWGTYGDHEIQATVSVKWPGIKTLTGYGHDSVNLPAPVDFGASSPGHGYFNMYGNMQYGDCWFASAADYIEMVTGKAPNSAVMINDYLAMVNKGESLQQWWEKGGPGLAGTHLISDTTWTTWTVPQVEHYLLTEHKPLYVSNLLPIEWGRAPDGGRGGHDWDIAGFSSYGPMIVTWGGEFQLPWGEFEYLTTSVESFTISG
jgi:hypothetical protein